MTKEKPGFILKFDPKPSPGYPHGYWCCYAEPGYDAAGATVQDAMAGVIMELSKALIEEIDKSAKLSRGTFALNLDR